MLPMVSTVQYQLCARKKACKIYMKGDAVFRQGARNLLSLTASGGSKIQLYETFFAAHVQAFGMTFDQLFFIIDSDQHEMLLVAMLLISFLHCSFV